MPTETKSQASEVPAPKLDVRATAGSPKLQRIPALDFTKGTLVLIMVLYHWMNYFTAVGWTYYKYLHFLTPSFIFITGFMISNVYLSKYDAADPRLPRRLFTRGLKLLAIFILLNLARNFVISFLGTGLPVRNEFDLENLFTVFISGNLPAGGAKLVAFSILVPISYLLMSSGILMFPYRRYRYTFHFVCLVLLLSILTLALNGEHSYVLEFIAIGMLGVLTGFAPIEAVGGFIRHPYILSVLYVSYLVAITIWDIPFAILIVGVYLSLTAIYVVGTNSGESRIIGSEIILLGKYSLFGYISQVAILQILSVGFRHARIGFGMLGVTFVAAAVLTIVSVEIVDRARRKAASIDRLYKAVFA